MNLSYSLKNGGMGSVHVKFDPPLAGYDDVKPRLLAMKADAQEALGMVRSYRSSRSYTHSPFTQLVGFQLQAPKITSFCWPNLTFPLSFLLGLAYLSLAPPQGTALPFVQADIADFVFTPARALVSAIGFQSIVQTIAVVHTFESLYTWHLCRRYVKGSFVTVSNDECLIFRISY